MVENMIFNVEGMVMKKVLFYLAAVAALVSCIKEAPVTDEGAVPETEGTVVSIIANAPSHVDANASSSKPQQSAATRTQLASDGKAVLWSPGDVVKVCFEPPYSTASSNSQIKREAVAELSAVISEASASAVFTGIWDETKPMYSVGAIVYPASVNFTSSQNTSNRYVTTNVSYNLPVVQEAIEGTFAENLNLSYATVTYMQLYNNNPNVTFKNVCSLIRINLPETDYNVKSIMIESGNELGIMAGNAKLLWETSSTSTGLSFKSSDPGISESTPVTLSKADGSNLVPGASYYAVVWPNTHNKLDFTFTDASGNTCVKTLDPGWVYCDPGKCLTVNVKSLSFSTTPVLDVDTTPITTSYTGGIESLNVYSNCPWTATSSNSAMITITESGASQLSFNVSVNSEPDARTADITISYGNGDKKVITVTQNALTYRISGGVVTRAASLEDGATYVIFYAGGSSNNQEQPYCWQVDGNGVVSRQSASDKNASFSRNRVFKFHKTSTLNGSWTSNGQDYRSASSGYLEAMYRNRYMVKSASNLDFTATSTSGAVDLRFGNAWADETGSDIDVWVSTSETIYWTGYYLYWGGTGNTPRKWFFYKAVEN